MEIDRRSVMLGLMASGLPLGSPTHADKSVADRASDGKTRQRFAAARRLNTGAFEAAVFDSLGNDITTVALPSRGHDVAVRRSTGECVVFARRPGTFAIAFNRPDAAPPVTMHAGVARHFYGHGVFSPDGRLLFTTENDFVNDLGIIGVRDAGNEYRRVGEFFSHGIGPHDIALLSDGHTLVIANGGILTHPEEGRRMLNVPSMQPNLAYIDTRSGALLEHHTLPRELHKLSIRHLSVTPSDEVVLGCQFVGSKSQVPMLVGTHRRQQPVQLLSAAPSTYGLLRNYVSSIATDRSGRYAVATSAKGGVALLFDLERRSVVKKVPLADVSGVARGADRSSFFLTSGEGVIYTWPMSGSLPRQTATNAKAWDNHLATMV